VSRAREDELLESAPVQYKQRLPPRAPENRAAVTHIALSIFDSTVVAAQLAPRVAKLGEHIATLELHPGRGLCVAKNGSTPLRTPQRPG
jgi:hypothetical protein